MHAQQAQPQGDAYQRKTGLLFHGTKARTVIESARHERACAHQHTSDRSNRYRPGHYVPAKHVQLEREGLPAALCELRGQFRQVADEVAPDTLEYLAAAQNVQPVLPTAVLYLPASQALQMTDGVIALELEALST